ncbi:O-methyltransferase [Saccharothrix sp. NPDC042600]|uniref:O-methyltransferase n=1 Tax=Saccharothrix TaxID=2071 RepID=UPI0033E8D451|nr:O-methyltransferase [Saccharothrix mutabilis subsp. capreolus]
MDAPLREYVERYLPEDAVVTAARARGEQLGCVPIGAGGGAALRFLATALRAKAVVEVGTGAGVGALYLLSGMPAAGILTSIDVEPEHQRAARKAFAEAGVGASRTRLIMGQALDVLPRLTDGAYDLVFVDAAKTEYPKYLEEAVRLLRPGGVVAFDNILWSGRVADPSHRDPDTVALREVARSVREDDRLVPVILPLGDGLLVAAKA